MDWREATLKNSEHIGKLIDQTAGLIDICRKLTARIEKLENEEVQNG